MQEKGKKEAQRDMAVGSFSFYGGNCWECWVLEQAVIGADCLLAAVPTLDNPIRTPSNFLTTPLIHDRH